MASSEQIRRSMSDVASKKADTDKRTSDALALQAKKAAEASKAMEKMSRASSASQRAMYAREAERATNAANDAAKKAGEWSKKSAGFSDQQARLTKDLDSALRSEASAAQRKADQTAREQARRAEQEKRALRQQFDATNRQQQAALAAERARTDSLIALAEDRMVAQLGAVRPPQPERLRIAYLTATPEGGLRVDEEVRRVKAAVQRSTHRDLVEITHFPAATGSDLLDSLMRVRPHVLHFSGHANEGIVVFDTGDDEHNDGHDVDADTFRKAVGSVDQPPVLVLLNACNSAAQLSALLGAVPLAIGMADSVGDRDAMAFAARFYSAVAEGQSVLAAFEVARVQMELDGLDDADLPVLEHRPGVDPSEVILVVPPDV
jgi:hypothetical protein